MTAAMTAFVAAAFASESSTNNVKDKAVCPANHKAKAECPAAKKCEGEKKAHSESKTEK